MSKKEFATPPDLDAVVGVQAAGILFQMKQHILYP